MGSAMVDPIWAPNVASSEITSLALAFGFLYLGGDQSSTAGLLVRLSATGVGMVDPLWQPLPTGRVRDLFISGTNLYVGGDFGRIGGRFLLDLGKVSALGAGQADPGWDPSPNGSVLVLAGTEGSLFVSRSKWLVIPSLNRRQVDDPEHRGRKKTIEEKRIPPVEKPGSDSPATRPTT